MRKISLTDGKLSVEILPDCGGAISALRWVARTGPAVNLLHPACPENRAVCDASRMSCIPVAQFANEAKSLSAAQPDLAEWTVQDASNIRATLTLHKGVGENESLQSSCQLLQRFELVPEGLKIQLTVTNIGVSPIAALAGLRVRPDWRGENILRGDLTPADGVRRSKDGELAGGYRLADRDVQVCLRQQGRALHYEWPEERLALVLIPVQGFDYVGLEYKAVQQEVRLTLLSHGVEDHSDYSGIPMLQQGDSLCTTLLLSAGMLAASGDAQPDPGRHATPKAG